MGALCCSGPQTARWNSRDRDGLLDYNNVYSEREEIAKMKPLFEALQLEERTIGKLYKMFNRVDNDKSGTIDIAELLMYLDVERTPFACRAFSVFDEDGSGTVDFREFILSLWNYSTLGKATLLIFAFDIYDTDNSGIIEAGEITHMLKDIYGENFERNANATSILKKVDSLGDVEINIDQFREFTRQHQALLFPAFTMQFKLQREILGKSFWTKMGKKRIELSKGRYLSIEEFMNLHVDTAKMDAELSNPKQMGAKSKSPHNRCSTHVYTHEKHTYLTEQGAMVLENSGSYSRRKSKSERSPRANESPRVRPTATVGDTTFTASRGPKFDQKSRRNALVRIDSGMLLDMAEYQVNAISQKLTKKELLQTSAAAKVELGMRNKGRRQTYTNLPTYVEPENIQSSNNTTPVNSRPSSTKSVKSASYAGAGAGASGINNSSKSKRKISDTQNSSLVNIAQTLSIDVHDRNKILANYGATAGKESDTTSSKKERRRTLG